MELITGNAVQKIENWNEPQLRFDPDKHEYWMGNRQLPSVTTIMKSAGILDFSGIPEEVLKKAQTRGSAVHLATQFFDEGTLDWKTVHPAIEGYVRAWERFRKETGYEPLEIEVPVYSPLYWFAGTPDRNKGRLNGNIILLEIKTAEESMPAAEVQTAGYTICTGPRTRYGIRLNANGTYNLYLFSNEETDKNVFLSGLAIWNFKKNLGRPV